MMNSLKTLAGTVAGLTLPLLGSASSYLRPGVYQHTGVRTASTSHSTLDAHSLLQAVQSAQQLPQAYSGDAEVHLHAGQAIRELLIIDAAVPDKTLFYRQAKPGVEIVEINSHEDGLQQLSAILDQYQNLDALHILSHAEAGTVLLGNSRITAETVRQHIEFTDGVNQALKDGADLLFYGCNLAANEQGEELLNIIAGQANVDVAASDDLTGAHVEGGDWDLEVVSGDIQADLPFSNKALADFSAVLAPVQYLATDFCTSNCFFSAASQTSSDGKFVLTGSAGVYAYDQGGSEVNGVFYLDFTSTASPAHMQMAADGTNLGSFQLSALSTYAFSGYTCTTSYVKGYKTDSTTVMDNFTTVAGSTVAINLANIAGQQITKFRVIFSGCTNNQGFYPVRLLNFQVDSLQAPSSNTAPSLANVPSDISVAQETASNLDLSAVTFTDTDGDPLTVTLTASTGTLAATTGGSVTVGGSGTGVLTLAGSIVNLHTYLDTAANVQYTGATGVSGDNAASLGIKANDGTDDSATSNVNLDISAFSLDFGDAPDGNGTGTSYPTNTTDGGEGVGASHIVLSSANPYLGDTGASPNPDDESDGQPNSGATGDDANGTTPDDEEGISNFVLSSSGSSGGSAQLKVGQAGSVSAWVDFDADGNWTDAGEQILSKQSLTAGSFSQSFDVPSGAALAGDFYTRWRICDNNPVDECDSPTGQANDGEVEDHLFAITPSLSVSAPAATDEGDSATTDFDFTITLDKASNQAVSVTAATEDGSATLADSDYTQISSQAVNFAAGETSKTVTVAVNGDTTKEANETFKLKLSSPSNATLGTSEATATINNDDNNAPTLNGAPTGLNFSEDTQGNVDLSAVTVADVDGDTLTLTLTASAGSLTTSAGAGITLGGTGSARTLAGTAAAINAYLDTASNIQYTGASDDNGSPAATLTLNVADASANSGDNTVNLNITAVNDEPSFTKGANQTVLEDAGAQSVSGWATAISTGPSNESTQTPSFTVTNNNNALFSAQPTLAANGTLSYTPATDANGSATVSVVLKDDGGTANSGDDTFATQTFTITVTAVNDEPSFTKGVDQTVLEDAGAQSVSGWATAISTGPSNESTQTPSFTVTNNNNALFSVQPVLAANGTLSYTPLADANGSATVSVVLKDDGGTANSGDDTFATQTFSITVNAVNDEPSFTKGANQMVNEDAGAQTVAAWATAISVGPANESSQSPSFTVTNDNNSLFSTQPSIAANGTLSYTPAASSNGSATVSVVLKDDGGTANSGDDSFATQTFTIAVTAVNDAPTLAAISNPAAIAEDASQQTVNLSGIGSGAANETQTLTVTASSSDTSVIPNPTVTYTSPNATGSLSYTPVANASGSATITVTVNDGGTSNNTVQRTFVVAVTAVNDAPTIAAIADQNLRENDGAQTVNLTGIGSGAANESDTLSITATSSDTGLIPNPTVTYTSAQTTGSLGFTPVADQFGSATITVTVDDAGAANNKTVETFSVNVAEVRHDFGDAPTNAQLAGFDYPSAKHEVPLTGATIYLGVVKPDAEGASQPSADAGAAGNSGDDNSSGTDDEDGVSVFSTASAASASSVKVNFPGAVAGKLDAFVDFNADGDWDDTGEQIFTSQDLAASSNDNTLNFSTPTIATKQYLAGKFFSRWRVSSAGGLSHSADGADGEVEDHLFVITPTLSVSGNSVAEGNSGSNDQNLFTVSLDKASNQTVTVTVNTSDGSSNGATAGSDYTAISNQTVTFSPGVTSQDVAVSVTGDTTGEADETVILTLSAASNASLPSTLTATGTISNDDNRAPSIISSSNPSVVENTSAVLSVTASDADTSDTLSFSIFGTFTGGNIDGQRFSINSSSGALSFVAAPDFELPGDNNSNNSYLVQVQVSDGKGGTDSQDMTVTVTDVDDAPTITNTDITPSFTENGSGTVATISNVSETGDTVTFALSGDDAALFNIDANGNLTFKNPPDAEYPLDKDANGVYDVTVTVTDSNNNSSQQSLNVTVTGVQDAPTFTNTATTPSFAENGTGTVTQITTVSEPGDGVTYSVSGDDAALFNIDANGNLTFKNPPDAENPQDKDANGVYDVTVTASDSQSPPNTASQDISVTVMDVNDAPIPSAGPTPTPSFTASPVPTLEPTSGPTPEPTPTRAPTPGPSPTPTSVPAPVPVADNDSVDNSIEDQVGDGNGDGVLDSAQGGVASTFFTLEENSDGDVKTSISVVALPDEFSSPISIRNLQIQRVADLVPADQIPSSDDQISLAPDILSFDLNGLSEVGQCLVTELIFGAIGEVPNFNVYFKFGQQNPGAEPSLYEFAFDGETGAEIERQIRNVNGSPREVLVVTLHLCDGLRGDGDGVADGVISDPGVPGVRLLPTPTPGSSDTPSPTASPLPTPSTAPDGPVPLPPLTVTGESSSGSGSLGLWSLLFMLLAQRRKALLLVSLSVLAFTAHAESWPHIQVVDPVQRLRLIESAQVRLKPQQLDVENTAIANLETGSYVTLSGIVGRYAYIETEDNVAGFVGVASVEPFQTDNSLQAVFHQTRIEQGGDTASWLGRWRNAVSKISISLLVGNSHTETSNAELQQAVIQSAPSAELKGLDNNASSFGMQLQLPLSARWDVRVAWQDLGDYEVDFSIDEDEVPALVAALAQHQPVGGEVISAQLAYHWPLGNWQAETALGFLKGMDTEVRASSSGQNFRVKAEDQSILLAAGVHYRWHPQWSSGLQLQYQELNDRLISTLLGLRYYF